MTYFRDRDLRYRPPRNWARTPWLTPVAAVWCLVFMIVGFVVGLWFATAMT